MKSILGEFQRLNNTCLNTWLKFIKTVYVRADIRTRDGWVGTDNALSHAVTQLFCQLKNVSNSSKA